MLRQCLSFRPDTRLFAESAKLEARTAADIVELVGDEQGNIDSSLRRAVDVGDLAPGQGAILVIERSASTREGRLRDWKSKAEDEQHANLEYWHGKLDSALSLSLPQPTAAPSIPAPTFVVRGDIAGAPTPVGNPECTPPAQCTNGCPSRWYTAIGTGEEMFVTVCDILFAPLVIVWKGTCENLQCLGTY
jgi:hypothetical protein